MEAKDSEVAGPAAPGAEPEPEPAPEVEGGGDSDTVHGEDDEGVVDDGGAIDDGPHEDKTGSIDKWMAADWAKRKHHRWDERVTDLGKWQDQEVLEHYAEEAGKVLCLAFDARLPLRSGTAKVLAAAGRWQPTLGEFSERHGLKHYCWLTPGEELCPDGGEPWVPCEHGGFVYSYVDDPATDHEKTCVYNVAGSSFSGSEQESFPETLGPLRVLSVPLKPTVDFEALQYSISTKTAGSLRSLGLGSSTITGKLSPVSKVTLPPDAKVKANIPEDATHFAWAYGCDLVDIDSSTVAKNAKKAKLSLAEQSFITVGSFLYFQAESDDDLSKAKLLGVNALSANSLGIRPGAADVPVPARSEFTVHVATWNVGNAPPPPNLHPWVPSGGRGADIIVVCGQEATYNKSKLPKEQPVGRLTGIIKSADFEVASTATKSKGLYCLLSVVGGPKDKVQEEARTWAAPSGSSPAAWNATFESYVEQKTSKETKLNDALPWLDVYGSTTQLQLKVKDTQPGTDPTMGQGVLELDLTELYSEEKLAELKAQGIQLHPESDNTRVPDGKKLAEIYGGDGKEVAVDLTAKGTKVGTVTLLLRYKLLRPVHEMAGAEAQTMLLQNTMKAEVKQNKSKRNGQVCITVVRATSLLAADRGNSSDPYCVIEALPETPGGAALHRETTPTVMNTLHPEWNYTTTIDTCVQTSAIKLTLMDYDQGSRDDVLGTCYLPIEYVDGFEEKTVRTMPPACHVSSASQTGATAV